MLRIGIIVICATGVALLSSCMTVRDRVATRIGLPTYEQKVIWENQYRSYLHDKYAAHPVQFQSHDRFAFMAEEKSAPRQEPRVVLSRTYPELDKKYIREKHQKVAKTEYYTLEKESARLNWETSLLRQEAESLHEELVALNSQWKDMSKVLAQVQKDRKRLHESMSQLDENLEVAFNRIEEIEMKRSQIATIGFSKKK